MIETLLEHPGIRTRHDRLADDYSIAAFADTENITLVGGAAIDVTGNSADTYVRAIPTATCWMEAMA